MNAMARQTLTSLCLKNVISPQKVWNTHGEHCNQKIVECNNSKSDSCPAASNAAAAAFLAPSAAAASMAPGAADNMISPGAADNMISPGAADNMISPGAATASISPGAVAASIAPGAAAASISPGAGIASISPSAAASMGCGCPGAAAAAAAAAAGPLRECPDPLRGHLKVLLAGFLFGAGAMGILNHFRRKCRSDLEALKEL